MLERMHKINNLNFKEIDKELDDGFNLKYKTKTNHNEFIKFTDETQTND